MFIYTMIFICKVIEDALATLRIIVVSNGKKIFGAILQFIIALIWIYVTGTVIIGLNEDPYKILFFALGSLFGSYLGSILEEKIALGNNIIMVEINNNHELINKLKQNYKTTITKTDNNKIMLMITLKRKEEEKIVDLIKKYDKNALIISEKIKIISKHI